MGNDLCVAKGQEQFKMACRQICSGAQDKVNKLKLEPITFSDNGGSPRENKYRDYDVVNEQSVEKLSIKQEQKHPSRDRYEQFLQTDNDPIKQSGFQRMNEQQVSSQFVNTKNSQFDCSSPTRNVKLNYKHLYLKHMNSNHQQGNVDYKPIPVPFSVIKMLLNKKIVAYIEQTDTKFFKKYQNDEKSFKLYKSGYYGNTFGNNWGVFLNTNYFYEGEYLEKQKGEIKPDRRGTYISEAGKYVGEFNDGIPHGNGRFYQYVDAYSNLGNSRDTYFSIHNTQFESMIEKMKPQNKSAQKNQFTYTVYEGIWKNGSLQKGSIENGLFKYEGQLKNRKPDGAGKICFKKSNAVYKGQFKNGQFYGNQSFYETQKYTYSGAFENGRKNGHGVLLQKVANIKTAKGKTRVEQKYEGDWKDDGLLYNEGKSQKNN